MPAPIAFSSATLRALIDRLIPVDEFPGAIEAGVESYLLRQLAADLADEAQDLAGGLRQLDAEARARHGGKAFDALSHLEQDALLSEIEHGNVATAWSGSLSADAFFARMVDLAHEGFYADPANGGNRDAISWRMIGYNSRTTSDPPRPPATSRPV